MVKVIDIRKFALIFIFLLSFSSFLSLQETSAATGLTDPTTPTTLVIVDDGMGGSYSLTPGDILTTNATSSSGFAGHSGIAVSYDWILHIAGPGETTKRISLAEWKKKYAGGTTWIHRVTNTSVRNDAAKYAVIKYWNGFGDITASQTKSPSYFISTNTASFDPTYCSKIVWQAYY